jgi:hypothetical protein
LRDACYSRERPTLLLERACRVTPGLG